MKESREYAGLTLRQVEEATEISNSYLSQLENDKIKRPSANVLYKLASLYRVNLDVLLSAAGIIEKASPRTPSSKTQDSLVNSIAFYAKNFTKEEEERVLEYIRFIISQKKNAQTRLSKGHW